MTYENGEGPALLLIHGMFGDYLDREPVLEPLSRSHRVVASDLPGFGTSARTGRPEMTVQVFLSALNQAAAVRRATVFGNSFRRAACDAVRPRLS